MFVFECRYNVKDDIAVPSHSYSTRLKSKMRKVFGQQRPKYKFIQYYDNHDLNVNYFKNVCIIYVWKVYSYLILL